MRLVPLEFLSVLKHFCLAYNYKDISAPTTLKYRLNLNRIRNIKKSFYVFGNYRCVKVKRKRVSIHVNTTKKNASKDSNF